VTESLEACGAVRAFEAGKKGISPAEGSTAWVEAAVLHSSSYLWLVWWHQVEVS